MNNRYLELDSSWRDRSRWPLPGQFEIPISQSGTKGRNDALDPVALSAPITSWTGNRFSTRGPGPLIAGTIHNLSSAGVIVNSISSAGSQDVVLVKFTASEINNQVQIIENYYKNAILFVVTGVNPVQRRRIISSKFIYELDDYTIMQFVIEYSFSDDVVYGNIVTINDPSDMLDVNNPQLFVPAGKSGEHAYSGYLLYNETLNQYRQITGYDRNTHILTVNTEQSSIAGTTQGPVTGWLQTHNYSIRKEPPSYTGTSLAGSTQTAVILNSAASSVDDFYNNYFLRMTSGGADDEIRLITDYDGTTKTVTVFPGFSTAPVAGNTLEILAFSYDNATPFNYSGSMVSQQEEVCYEIELLNLVLPNRTLNTAFGANIAFYPYVYVNLCNVTAAGSGNINVLYSNNPNASRVLFRAAINDVANLTTSSFVKIGGGGTYQTVKFKPNDNLLFEVRLPNGDIFETTLTETFSPHTPNAENQISALFSMKRL